ncbi:MAG: potassium-transporting ATPase subunit C [Chitinophagaceae bacterium]
MLKDIRPAIVLVVALTPDHRPRLSIGDDRHRRHDLSEAGPGQPDRARRQGHRLRADRPGIHQPRLLPRPALATTAADPNDSTKTVPSPLQRRQLGRVHLGPTNKALIDRVKGDVEKLHAENPSAQVPIDLVTTTASGLDPDISPQAALFQVPRVAKERKMPEDRVRQIVNDNTEAARSACWASRA